MITARVCSVDGCGKRLKARGLCTMHYARLRRQGDPRLGTNKAGLPLHRRIWESVVLADTADQNPCWLWTGHCVTGYGSLRWKGQQVKAHRASYEVHIGPVPEGLHLDHLCRTPRCVNPWHLEPVTVRENIVRGIGPSAVNAAKTHCKWGHEFTSENTYARKGRNGSTARGCRTCALARSRAYRQATREAA